MDQDLDDQVVETPARGVASGAISANGHGNVSIRPAGLDEMYFMAGPPLRGHPFSALAPVGLDGIVREGDLPPIQRAVVAMHTAMYADRPVVGCVLHTHSPLATAYAVARRPVGCWSEAQAMFGLPGGVPVAGYGPRGSDEPVARCTPASHGVRDGRNRTGVTTAAMTRRRSAEVQTNPCATAGPAAPIRHRTDVMQRTLVAVPVVPEGF